MNNERGENFDIASSVSKQLPFFSCINVLYNRDAQKYIEKYLYCKEFGVSPYSGSYNTHPKKWIDRAFLIKKSINKKESDMIKKQQSEHK